MDSSLSKYILTTITYYDVMDYPMTAFEVWKYLTKISNSQFLISNDNEKISLYDVIKELEGDKLKKFIEEYRGFYFLKGRKDLVAQRLERNKISESKYKILMRSVWWLRFMPYVRMVAVTGRMAMKNAESQSDLDLMIVLEPKKIFTGRFFVTVALHLLKKRRHADKIKNRICLNHFMSGNCEVSVKDIFSSHEYSFMLPVFGFEEFLKFQEKNSWIKKYRPNLNEPLPNMKILKDSRASRSVRKVLERFFNFDLIENKLKKWQSRKIKNNPMTDNKEGVIICQDQELAFWPDFENQGPKFFEAFRKRLEKLKS